MAIAGSFEMHISGFAQVYCVHDREKRQLVDIAFDPSATKVHLCACCENLFLERTDTPMFCTQCRGPLAHMPGGPLPDPRGVVG